MIQDPEAPRDLLDRLGEALQDPGAGTTGEAAVETVRWFTSLAPWIEQLVGLGALIVLAALVAFAVALLRRFAIEPLIRRSVITWDDLLVEQQVLRWPGHLLPVLVVHAAAPLAPGMHPDLHGRVLVDGLPDLVRNAAAAAMVACAVLGLAALLNAANALYARRPQARHRPIKGYLTLVKIFLYVVGTVTAAAFLFGKDPTAFLVSIGGMTAVLMLVFKDTLLSLVASIQLTSQDMVRVGDWITVPSAGADGDVIDIALHTVQVRNWDRTITTVPTTSLVTDSFKNWRTMSEGPGRRVKRSLRLDLASIRFVTDEELAGYGRIGVLREFVAAKQAGLADGGASEGPDPRRPTNAGVFRAYMDGYLRAHPRINTDLTFLVRPLEPDEHGLPIEIYLFTATTRWAEYEAIQAEVFDHVLAAAGTFDLRLYQSPGGHDVRLLRGTPPPRDEIVTPPSPPPP